MRKNRGTYGFLSTSWVLITSNICPLVVQTFSWGRAPQETQLSMSGEIRVRNSRAFILKLVWNTPFFSSKKPSLLVLVIGRAGAAVTRSKVHPKAESFMRCMHQTKPTCWHHSQRLLSTWGTMLCTASRSVVACWCRSVV